MTYINYETHAKEYQDLWNTMHIIRDDAELQRVSDKLTKYKDVYQKVEKDTGVPWQVVAVIHVREAGETDLGVWKRCLHDGERIIGTGRKTRDVPRGRGPFDTWHEAALDAIKIQGFDKIKEWPVSRMLWALEPYNGYGYRNKGLRSPYLWASTNHQQRGKYVSDGVFNASVMDTQVGCAALLKYLGVDKKTNTVHDTAGTAGFLGLLFTAYHYGAEHPYLIAGVAVGLAALWYLLRKKNTHVG